MFMHFFFIIAYKQKELPIYCATYCDKLGFLQFLRSHIFRQTEATLEREFSRVVDTDSLNPDPDPAFQARIRIRIQGFDDQKLKKKKSRHFFLLFLTNIAIKFSLALHKGRTSYKRSLQLSKENIQHFKKMKIINFFLFLWVIFALLEPDPDPDCESGY
jgi:hypothetical protein